MTEPHHPEGALDIVDLAEARRIVTQLRAENLRLRDDVALFKHGHRIASDNCVRLEKALEHMTANHADLARRNALLSERPDLPVDRLPAHRELVRLQTLMRETPFDAGDLARARIVVEHLHELFPALANRQTGSTMRDRNHD